MNITMSKQITPFSQEIKATFEVVIMCIPRLLQSFIYQTLLWKRSYCIKM